MTTLATEARQMREQARQMHVETLRCQKSCLQMHAYLHASLTTKFVLWHIAENGSESPFSRRQPSETL